MRLYVASSWRNPQQPSVVAALRTDGHDVYDFRHPPGGDHLGFSWAEIDPDWQSWTAEQYVAALHHPTAQAGFASDFGAMQRATGGVLVLPSGRSAHLEAGYFVGAGKPLWVLIDPAEFGHGDTVACTELMYLMASRPRIHTRLQALAQDIRVEHEWQFALDPLARVNMHEAHHDYGQLDTAAFDAKYPGWATNEAFQTRLRETFA